jgi:uncharacterized protein YjbI with pentapeptide repeats
MANEEYVAQKGVAAWNSWRAENDRVPVDLRFATLPGADLTAANLTGALLGGALLYLKSLERVLRDLVVSVP